MFLKCFVLKSIHFKLKALFFIVKWKILKIILVYVIGLALVYALSLGNSSLNEDNNTLVVKYNNEDCSYNY